LFAEEEKPRIFSSGIVRINAEQHKEKWDEQQSFVAVRKICANKVNLRGNVPWIMVILKW
jgi:hypothetical protein